MINLHAELQPWRYTAKAIARCREIAALIRAMAPGLRYQGGKLSEAT